MSYREKLRLPQWQKKRLEVMHRDEWRCIACGDEKTTLNVHHKEYRKGADPWDYPDDNFETLCEPCHAKKHNTTKALDHRVDETAKYNTSKIHGGIKFLCAICMKSTQLQDIIRWALPSMGKYAETIEGFSLLQKIINAAPNPNCPEIVSRFSQSLNPEYRADLFHCLEFYDIIGGGDDPIYETQMALRAVSVSILHRRDREMKDFLRKPGLAHKELMVALSEAKEITTQLRVVGQRTEFYDGDGRHFHLLL